MGEAKRRREALAAQLGETRADGFDEFKSLIHDLRATEGARVDQLDRLRFHELFSIALVEGCRERAGDNPDGKREIELMQAAGIAAGVSLTSTFLGRFDAPEDRVMEFVANTLIQAFANGVMVSLESITKPNGAAQ